MKSLGLLVTFLALSVSAQSAGFTVLSGASYQTAVAPNSWAIAFGSALAQSTAIATPLSSGEWPTTLANITVQVDGQPAELYYVSSGQINFLVPNLTDFGSVNVVIANSASGATLTSSVMLQNSAVGIFTSNSTGSGPGAILNGVTGAPSPFLVVTPENGGGDLRTRLAIYCTGLRYAGNSTHDPSITNVAAGVTALGKDTAGNQYNFAVEYAGGSDPTFPGLDQVNIVLPAEVDGAGVISLTVTAENFTSNVVTFQVNSLPASQIALAGFTLSTNETIGGTAVTGTVSINGVARAGGFPISVRSSDPTIVTPAAVTIPQGQTSSTFNISTPVVGSIKNVTFTAQAIGVSFTAALQVDPSSLAQLNLFTVTNPTVQGGANLNATVGISANAPLGGTSVQISSNDAAVVPPASVTVQVNSMTKDFTVPTTAVTAVHTATLTATLGSVSRTQQVTIVPPVQLALSTNSVTGGTSVTGTVTLGTSAPTTGVNVTLSSNATAFASVPAIVNIPGGQTTATFTVTTFAVTAVHTVTITATDGLVGTATASLTVNPQVAGQLQSVAVSPAQVGGGSNATGTVTLSGNASFGGLVVALRSSNILVATVPLTVTVAQGASSATFTVATTKVATTQTVTITATAGSVSQTATLKVQ